MRRHVLALAVVAGACKGDAPAKVATGSGSAAARDAALPDATIGSVLDLFACTPAPMPPAEPPWMIGGGRRSGGQGFGVGQMNLNPISGGGTSAGVRLGTTKEAGLKGAGAVLRKHANRLRYCYEQNLGRVPNLTGATTLSIIIKDSGYPHEVIIDDSLDNELSLCLKHIVMEIQFPKPAKAPVTITQPLTFSWKPMTHPVQEPTAWIPYATSTSMVPTEIGVTAALGLQKAMPTAKLASCLGPQHTGSMRALARIGMDGSVISARAGGFGDRVVDACLSAALVGVKTAPVGLVTDVACDFVRGDPAPWRIAVDAGYRVLDRRFKDPPQSPVPKFDEPPGERPDTWLPDPSTDPSQTFLVLVDPPTSLTALRNALMAATRGAAYVVAMRIDERAPIFLLAGRGPGAVPDPAAPLLLDAREPLRICNGLLDAPASAPFADAEKLLAKVARRCTHKPCPAQLTITLPADKTVDQIATLVAAARRAGFERIRLGDGVCPQ